MKEIKVQKTIEEVIGYEANDGTRFTSKEECEKYEESSLAAIKKMFLDICVEPKRCNGKIFTECGIWEDYGYGSEEYAFVIADIKNEEDLRIANMFCRLWANEKDARKMLDVKYIGRRILIGIGFDDWCHEFNVRGTEEELIEMFKSNLADFFRSETAEA